MNKTVIQSYLSKRREWTWKNINNILSLSWKEVGKIFNKGNVRMNLTNFTTKKLITYDKLTYIFQIVVTINNTILVIRRSSDM